MVRAAEAQHRQNNATIPEPSTEFGIDVSTQHRANLDEVAAFVELKANCNHLLDYPSGSKCVRDYNAPLLDIFAVQGTRSSTTAKRGQDCAAPPYRRSFAAEEPTTTLWSLSGWQAGYGYTGSCNRPTTRGVWMRAGGATPILAVGTGERAHTQFRAAVAGCFASRATRSQAGLKRRQRIGAGQAGIIFPECRAWT